MSVTSISSAGESFATAPPSRWNQPRWGFTPRFGEPPSNYAANGYDAARVLFLVMQAGNRSGPAIRDELLRGEYRGLTGPFSFDHNGDVRKPVLIKIKQFTAGKFRVVVPLLDYTAQIAALR